MRFHPTPGPLGAWSLQSLKHADRRDELRFDPHLGGHVESRDRALGR